MTAGHILAIDQGTTSTRAIVFDRRGQPVATAQREFEQHYPRSGWVEHDLETIWRDTLAMSEAAIRQAGLEAGDIAAIGITNQRETTCLWDRSSGEPAHRAIVWQDRRTAGLCRNLAADGHETLVRERTGLVIDPYFSATKLAWLLDEVPGARAAAERGDLAFGTIDSFLLWRLTGGRVHATDASNASRTMLFNIHRQDWDDDLLRILNIPRTVLPEVRDCSTLFGTTPSAMFGRPLPVTGIAGDQQAAAVGQACFAPGMLKSTYGTGCFALLNTGGEPVPSRHRLLTTVAYRLGGDVTYCLEGSIFVAGAAVQWLRDSVVPAFVGLGAPHWDPDARGAIFGLTRASGVPHIARAVLEAVGYQTRDLISAMDADLEGRRIRPQAVRVDGGMVANNWLCQFLADCLDLPVERPEITETTALGAACLAGLEAGLYDSLDAVAGSWRRERRFDPAMDKGRRDALYAGWRDAVRRTLSAT